MSKSFLATLAAIGGIIVLSYVGFVAFFFLKPVYDDYANRVPFDQASWMIAERADANPNRVRMVDDLLATRDLRGMTRQEVTTLLGEPPETGYFSGWDLVYWLGPERGFFSIDSEWLVLRFDDSGKVADHAVVTD